MFAICMALIDDEEDKRKFEKLYNRNSNRAYAVAYKILKNNALAEEACSEAFLNIAKCFQKINNFSLHDIDAYLFRTIMNVCYSKYNTESKTSNISIDILNSDQEPSDDCFNDIDYNLLVSHIKQLDEKYKTVLAYKIYYGLNADEIAKTMGISRRTVFNYLNNAKRILTEKIGEENNE